MKKKVTAFMLALILGILSFATAAYASYDSTWFHMNRNSLTLYMGEGTKKITQYVRYDGMTIYGKTRNRSIADIDWKKTRADDEIWYIKPVGVGKTYINFEDDYGHSLNFKVVVKPMRERGLEAATSIRTVYRGDNRINGKTVPGAKVTFKIKGKTYSVKADKKGKFTISVKPVKVSQINFKVSYGKLKITKTAKVKE